MGFARFAVRRSVRLLRNKSMKTGIGSLGRGSFSAMRHRVTIQSVVSTLDSSRQTVYTYTTRYADEPAAYRQVTGGEYVRGRQIEAGTTAIFEVNYRDGYMVTDRVLFKGVYYGVVRIDQPDGVDRFTILHCSA